jgi:Fe-Mn family superoxide dismutase
MTTHQLPPLPYAFDALEPHISRETVDIHYNRHHKGYVDKLNQLVAGTFWEGKSLEETILGTFRQQIKIFNQAAQAWNHDFYWRSLTPAKGRGSSKPEGSLHQALVRSFGTLEKFQEEFKKEATEAFGSGWAWLVADQKGDLRIAITHDGDNPLTTGAHPLLACDVWEHAYYVDYRNLRAKYLDQIWSVFNWDFAAQNYEHRAVRAA